jgi:hypothetical protein
LLNTPRSINSSNRIKTRNPVKKIISLLIAIVKSIGNAKLCFLPTTLDYFLPTAKDVVL